MTWAGRIARRGRSSLGLVILLTAVLLIPGAAVAAMPGTATSGERPNAPLLASLGPFAERAGFNSGLLTEVPNVEATTATTDVVLSFVPSSPTFYDPPAAGASPMSVNEIATEWGLSPSSYAAAEGYFEQYRNRRTTRLVRPTLVEPRRKCNRIRSGLRHDPPFGNR